MNPAGTTLRLLWPQWQGATKDNVAALVPEVPLADARHGYAVGTRVLSAVLPAHDGPVATVPVATDDRGLDTHDGVEAKQVVLEQLRAALNLITAHGADRIVTLGGECSVSVAPFTALAQRYGDDLAVVWIDAHPDVGTPDSEYAGYHAMALSAITGHGDPDVLAALPATVDPTRVALAGTHSWTEDDFPNAAAWGIPVLGPDQLADGPAPLLNWLRATGCTRVAIHLDVDVVDSQEMVLGLGAEPGGLSSTQVRGLIEALAGAADVVGLTVAEYVPRQVLQVTQLLRGLPLLGGA